MMLLLIIIIVIIIIIIIITTSRRPGCYVITKGRREQLQEQNYSVT